MWVSGGKLVDGSTTARSAVRTLEMAAARKFLRPDAAPLGFAPETLGRGVKSCR